MRFTDRFSTMFNAQRDAATEEAQYVCRRASTCDPTPIAVLLEQRITQQHKASAENVHVPLPANHPRAEIFRRLRRDATKEAQEVCTKAANGVPRNIDAVANLLKRRAQTQCRRNAVPAVQSRSRRNAVTTAQPEFCFGTSNADRREAYEMCRSILGNKAFANIEKTLKQQQEAARRQERYRKQREAELAEAKELCSGSVCLTPRQFSRISQTVARRVHDHCRPQSPFVAPSSMDDVAEAQDACSRHSCLTGEQVNAIKRVLCRGRGAPPPPPAPVTASVPPMVGNLQKLIAMGFTDVTSNVHALLQCDNNLADACVCLCAAYL